MNPLHETQVFSCVRRAGVWVIALAGIGLAAALPGTGSGADKPDVEKRLALKPIGDPVRDPATSRGRVFVSPDAKLVCVKGKDDKTFVWDIAKQAKALEFDGAAVALDFGAGGKWLLVNLSGMPQLWDTATGKAAGEPLPKVGGTGVRAFSADGTTLAHYDRNKKEVQVWDTLTAKPLGEPISMPNDLSAFASSYHPLVPSLTMAGHGADLLLLSPDGKVLLTQNAVKGRPVEVDIFLWDVATGKQIAQLDVPKNKPPANLNYDCCFNPDGKTLAVLGSGVRNSRGGFQPTAITIFDAATGKATGSPVKVEEETSMMIFLYTPDGKSLLTERQLDDGGKELVLYDIESGKATRRFALSAEATNGAKVTVHYGAEVAAFTPDGKTLLTGSRHVAYRAPRGGVVAPLPGQAKDGFSHCVLVWGVETGKPVAAPQYFEAKIVQLVTAPDGKSFWTATGLSESGPIAAAQSGPFEAQQWQLPQQKKSPGESEKDKAK